MTHGDDTVVLDIILNNPRGVYQPGDLLSGHVTLETGEDIPLCGIYLWILGQADVTWPDNREKGASHFDYEIYMKECLNIWGQERHNLSDETAETTTIGAKNSFLAGDHRFDFEYILPATLPSSFETFDVELKGRVHYLLRVKLDSINARLRQHKDQAFLVLRTFDLNAKRDIFEAVALHSEDVTCGSPCFCSSGPVSCSVRLDRTGFVPGEDISVNVQIDNCSYKDAASSFVAMKQIVHLHASTASKRCVYDIFCLTGGKVKSGDNALYHDIIHIPPLPPSRLEGCSIIDIEYIIQVGVILVGSTSALLELTVPITIGTVPLRHILPPGLHLSSSFHRYSHTSGSIEAFNNEHLRSGLCQHVYLYYKCMHQPMNDVVNEDVTSLSDGKTKLSDEGLTVTHSQPHSNHIGHTIIENGIK